MKYDMSVKTALYDVSHGTPNQIADLKSSAQRVGFFNIGSGIGQNTG